MLVGELVWRLFEAVEFVLDRLFGFLPFWLFGQDLDGYQPSSSSATKESKECYSLFAGTVGVVMTEGFTLMATEQGQGQRVLALGLYLFFAIVTLGVFVGLLRAQTDGTIKKPFYSKDSRVFGRWCFSISIIAVVGLTSLWFTNQIPGQTNLVSAKFYSFKSEDAKGGYLVFKFEIPFESCGMERIAQLEVEKEFLEEWQIKGESRLFNSKNLRNDSAEEQPSFVVSGQDPESNIFVWNIMPSDSTEYWFQVFVVPKDADKLSRKEVEEKIKELETRIHKNNVVRFNSIQKLQSPVNKEKNKWFFFLQSN